ncbi:hypothetical protein SMC50_003158 [Cronobacter sakazakii]|nr:hypothetical protein [Cronobacter sakazakii]ELY2637478.1 hypothetical protein [Cronobacter sakazakii]ELY2658512.1 hypothetical protein [Cronobacter sakazakii]ELY4639715.1 hypothetical protein [Cronobacter sakazakii]ELY4833898.1 hypothetical protein [Cronobacter sakazakii]
MITISNERLEKMAAGGGFNFNEAEAISSELLALRKERERAEPVAYIIQDKYHREKGDEGYLSRVHASRYIPGDDIFKDGVVCTPLFKEAPTAPSIADDSLPHDPQIAEYEQMMEAELKAAARTAYKVKSELSQMAEKLVRDTTALAATLSAETDTTSQQFESLAGKAVVTDENGNLPCPFCGGRCDPNGWMGSYDDGVPMCGPECEDCGATANSIEEWNRRSTALAGKAVVPEGWKLVPVEPTDAMCDIGHIGVDVLTGVTDDNEYYSIDGPYAAKVYRAMIAAAPEPCK